VTDCLLGLRVRILPGTRISVSFDCFVPSVICFCEGPIPRSEESYGLWCVIVRYLEVPISAVSSEEIKLSPLFIGSFQLRQTLKFP
jgi:hypothetical protein